MAGLAAATIAGKVGAFALKHWSWFAIAGLVITLGVQNARLEHAKADQWDRGTCAAHAPCKPVLWRDEAKSLAGDLAARERDLKACWVDRATLEQAVATQTAAVTAMGAQGRAALAQAQAAVTAQQKGAAATAAALRALSKPPAGATECDRMGSVHDTFTGTIR